MIFLVPEKKSSIRKGFTMKILFAIDIMDGIVVHGYKGKRDGYRPLDWGLARSVIPHEYISEMGIKYPYLADLDRIEGKGDNDGAVLACRGVKTAYLNRGARSPEDAMKEPWIKNVVSTETCRGEPSGYTDFDYFSIVVKDKKAVPGGGEPSIILKNASDYSFKGYIILNLSSVGAEDSMGGLDIEGLRDSCSSELFYGGGVTGMDDLWRLKDAGFDGAIIATAVHKGLIPQEIVKKGFLC